MDDKTTAKQRYDRRIRAEQSMALKEKPALLARCDELEESIKYLYQENKALAARVTELEDRIEALERR